MNKPHIFVEAVKDPVRMPGVERVILEDGRETGLVYPGDPPYEVDMNDPVLARYVRRRINVNDLREVAAPAVPQPIEPAGQTTATVTTGNELAERKE